MPFPAAPHRTPAAYPQAQVTLLLCGRGPLPAGSHPTAHTDITDLPRTPRPPARAATRPLPAAPPACSGPSPHLHLPPAALATSLPSRPPGQDLMDVFWLVPSGLSRSPRGGGRAGWWGGGFYWSRAERAAAAFSHPQLLIDHQQGAGGEGIRASPWHMGCWGSNSGPLALKPNTFSTLPTSRPRCRSSVPRGHLLFFISLPGGETEQTDRQYRTTALLTGAPEWRPGG